MVARAIKSAQIITSECNDVDGDDNDDIRDTDGDYEYDDNHCDTDSDAQTEHGDI